MTDAAAAPAAAPSSATNGAAAPPAPVSQPASQPASNGQIHAGDNFQEFQAQVQRRMEARAKAPTNLRVPTAQGNPEQPAPTPTQPQPAQQPAQDPTQQPATDPVTEPTDPSAEPTQEPTQITPEDMELLAKAKQWLASDEIPEEFAQRLVRLKNGEEEVFEPFDEVRQGRMRQRDYTRAMQQHLQEKQAWQANENAYKAHFDAIFNDEQDGAAGGDAMYEIYTRAGKRRQLLALGTRLAREEQQIIDGANGVGYAIMHRLGIQDPNDYRVQSAVKREYQRRHDELDQQARIRAVAFENEQLRRVAQQRQQTSVDDQHFASQRKSLEQLRPRAFAALGLNHDDPNHRRHFNIYLGSIIRTENLHKVTPELVMKAARAAREEIELQRKQLAGANGGPAKTGQPVGFHPQLGPGGGAPAASKPQQWHSEAFAERFKLPRW